MSDTFVIILSTNCNGNSWTKTFSYSCTFSRHFALRFLAALALHKCSFSTDVWRRLGIARSNKFVGFCARLAQTLVFICPRISRMYTNLLQWVNGDLVGRTNLTNFRASERRAEFIRAMPSAAENLKANTLN